MNIRKIIFILGIAVVVIGSIYFMSKSSSYVVPANNNRGNQPSASGTTTVRTATGTVQTSAGTVQYTNQIIVK